MLHKMVTSVKIPWSSRKLQRLMGRWFIDMVRLREENMTGICMFTAKFWNNCRMCCMWMGRSTVYMSTAGKINEMWSMSHSRGQTSLLSSVRQVTASKVGVTVDWYYKNVKLSWTTVDLKQKMRVGKSPVGPLYVPVLLMDNTQTCLYQRTVPQYFHFGPSRYQNTCYVDKVQFFTCSATFSMSRDTKLWRWREN